MNIQELEDFGIPKDLVDQLHQRGFKTLTAVQSASIKQGLINGQSLVISAPTSSGKTTIAELAAIVAAQQGRRTVYLVTHKALAEEKYNYFKAAYDNTDDPWFRVSISTGDRTEGEWTSGILVATYEKFLSLIGNRAISNFGKLVVVADEIQTVATPSRGADIEILCTILLHAKPAQFIGLSATAPNVDELAAWLNCAACKVTQRDVPLLQEIWYSGKVTYCSASESETFVNENGPPTGIGTVLSAKLLVDEGLSPVLVFCMTKPRAEQLAAEYSGLNVKRSISHDLSKQLDLFSEPTSLGQRLRSVAEHRVAFHTADLSFSERTVVEQALRDKMLDVVFATPTLAAGVNLPIRTVLFDTFQRGWMDPPWLSQSEFTNMAGRAGRLGYHEVGTVVLVPANRTEYAKAYEHITEQPEAVRSVLMGSSIRKPILQLLSCGVCSGNRSLLSFFEKTLWFQQTLHSNTILAKQLSVRIKEAVDWLKEHALLAENGDDVTATELGRAVSATGLLPSSAIAMQSLISKFRPGEIDTNTFSLIHLACASDEFSEEIGQRFLPYASKGQAVPAAYKAVRTQRLLVDPDARSNQPQVDNASFALSLWIEGKTESDLIKAVPSIRYGQLQVLAQDVGWIFESISSLLKSPAVDADPQLVTEIQLLAKRIRLGVTVDAIDVLEAARNENVPGFGRHRAMNLVSANVSQPNKLLATKPEVIARLIEGSARAEALLQAIARLFAKPMEYWRNRHVALASELRADVTLIEALYDCDGTAYEDAVLTLLKRMDLLAEKYDDGKRQGVPDLLLKLDTGNVFIECKSREHKKNSPISTEDAFAVLTKANDLDPKHCITVAKPDVGSHAKKKATSTGSVTLISHKSLIQAYLAYFSGRVPIHKIVSWLTRPGYAQDIEV